MSVKIKNSQIIAFPMLFYIYINIVNKIVTFGDIFLIWNIYIQLNASIAKTYKLTHGAGV